MSQTNTEIVRAIVEPWASGDFGSAEWAHPEIEHVIADGPEPGRSTGVPGMVKSWREFLSAWDGWHGNADEYYEVDRGRVLVLFHFRAQGKGSGLEAGAIRAEGGLVFHLRDGKVIRLVHYWDPKRAREAVGLAE